MKLSYKIIFILLLTYCFSCDLAKDYSVDYKQVNINVDNLPNESIHTWFDSLEFVSLEDSETSLIKAIDKIMIYQGNYYILDRGQHTIFAFNTDGRFISSTKSIHGQGPEEYISLVDFDIDTDNGNIHMLDAFAYKIKVYTKDFEFVENIKLASELLPFSKFKYLKDDLYVFYSKRRNKTIVFYSTTRDSILGEALPVNELSEHLPIVQESPFYSLNGQTYLTHQYPNNDLYKLDLDNYTIEKKIEYGFLEKTFNIANIEKGQDMLYYQNYIESNNRNYMFIVNKSENNKYSFISGYYNNKLYIIKCDKNNHEESTIINDFAENKREMLSVPMFVDDNYYYTIVDLESVKYVMSPLLTSESKENLKTMKDDCNPIIVKYHIKD